MKRHCFTGRRGSSGTKEAERYLLMACYSSHVPGGEGGGGGRLQSQVLHFHYVLVSPIDIQKCLVITRSGFIYMQSGARNTATEKEKKKSFRLSTHFSFSSLLLISTLSLSLQVNFPLMKKCVT